MKQKKISAILCFCMFIVFSVSALLCYLHISKNREISPILSENVTSVTQEQSGNGFYYSAGAKIVYLDAEGNQAEAVDLTDKTGGERIFSLKKLEGTNLFLTFSDNTMAYLLEEHGDKLEVKGSFSYNGKPYKAVVGNDEIYVICEVSNYCEVRTYDLNNVSADFTRRGILYNYAGKSDGKITLSLAKGLKFVDAFAENGMLYVIHEGGLYVMDGSLKMNDFKFISEKERSAAGVVSYNKNSYEVVLDEASFDDKALMIYTMGISTGCYNDADQTMYFVSNERKLMSYTLADVGSQSIGSELAMQEVPGLKLDVTQTAKPSMYYDARNHRGYVTFDTISDLICVDFNEKEIVFHTKGEFDVKDISANSSGNKILLMHMDTNTGTIEQQYLKLMDAQGQEQRTTFRVLSVVLLILAVIALSLFIFERAHTRNAQFHAKVKRTMKLMWKHKWIYIILVPSLIGLFMFCYYPGIASLGMSFFDYTAEKQSMKWNNFANYVSIFTEQASLEAFRNMVIFAVTDIITSLIPPLIFAFFLSFMRSKRFSNFTRTLLFIPGVIPSVAGMLLWKTGIYGEYGVLNTVIQMLHGEPVKFLTSSSTALISIIMMGFPFIGSYLIFYGAIMNIADSYIEAAELEGCPLMKRIWRIDLPLILPQIKYVLIMTLIATAQNFNRVYMTTGGAWGTDIPINKMYNYLISGNYGQSSAYAAILFIVMFIPMMLNLKTQKKGME